MQDTRIFLNHVRAELQGLRAAGLYKTERVIDHAAGRA